MSTDLKGTTCRTGEVHMVSFAGGKDDGKCVQLTFKKPEYEEGNPDMGWWYVQLTKAQALEMAAALTEFANDTREEACYE